MRLRVYGSGFRACSLRFTVKFYGSGCSLRFIRFRVQGLGWRVMVNRCADDRSHGLLGAAYSFPGISPWAQFVVSGQGPKVETSNEAHEPHCNLNPKPYPQKLKP